MDRLTQQTQRYIALDIGLISITLAISVSAIWLGLEPNVVYIVAGWFLISFALMVILYALTKRKALLDYQRLTSQGVWAHWQYHQQEWDSITKNADTLTLLAQQASGWKPMLLRNARLFGILAFLSTSGILMRYGFISLIAALLSGVGIYLIFYRSANRVEASLKTPYPLSENEISDVYVGEHGIVFPGSFVLFSQPRLQIHDVKIEGGRPRQLHIAFFHNFSHQNIPYDLILPIPCNHEDEGQSILSRIYNQRMQSQMKKTTS